MSDRESPNQQSGLVGLRGIQDRRTGDLNSTISQQSFFVGSDKFGAAAGINAFYEPFSVKFR
ncbi:hypothetical protein Pan14r_21040 [Crateriforma conspicua]|uniref:Uncharacterized protein n=1 Tax=Crateriforma conspicua TaxID=2527996 RepID=A0A5C5Y3J9_9PLAN|nr:hypothetical protein Pan14r_21040 [Crateriforma conspicua]